MKLLKIFMSTTKHPFIFFGLTSSGEFFFKHEVTGYLYYVKGFSDRSIRDELYSPVKCLGEITINDLNEVTEYLKSVATGVN